MKLRKKRTRVFAGGAVIAEQPSSFDAQGNTTAEGNVQWIHADPVTGSKQIALKTGESYNYLRTEYEPLGQEVTPEEPIQEFPVGSTASSFSASEPEWLCQYASKENSFMPTRCMQADNESLEWWLVWRESNPKKIAGEVKTTTGNLGTTINLRATLKPDGSTNGSGGSAVAPASRPSSSGASGPNAEDFKAETDIGSFPVEKSLIDPSDTGGLDAEFSGQTESNNLRNFRQSVADVRTILRENENCRNFFGGLGENALDALSDAVGESSFITLTKEDGNREFSTGIRMNITLEYASNSVPLRLISQDGSSGFGFIKPNNVSINTNGAFVRVFGIGNDRLPRFGGYNPGSRESRITQILHEIGHLIFVGNRITSTLFKDGEKYKNGQKLILLLTEDGKNPSLSDTNTTRVLGACRNAITTFINNQNNRRNN